MNKIFNWTLGSVFRTIGRVIGYLLIGGLLALFMSKNGLKITDLFGIDTIHASTISYDYSKYFVRTTDYSYANSDNTWSSALNFGDFYNTTDIGYVNSIRARFGVNNKFQANTKYRVKINVKFNNDTNKDIYLNPDSIICQGSATNTWSSDENLIDNCKFVARTFYNENKNASYLFDITPNTNIYGIQIAFYIKGSRYYLWSGDRIQAIRVLASSNITTDTSTSDSIDNQTTEIIYNQNQNTEQIINNQNELLGDKCDNLIDVSKLPTTYTSGGITTTRDGNKFYSKGTGSSTSFQVMSDSNYYILNLKQGQRYYFNINKKLPQNIYFRYQNNGNWTSVPLTAGNTSVSFTPSSDVNTGTFWFGGGYTTGTSINWQGYSVYVGLTSSYCDYGSYQSKLDSTNQAINNLNDTMNNSDSSGAQSDAGNFFSGFNTNTHGLTGIITAPLNAIQSLTSQSCSPLVIPLPFVNQNLTLPCMRTIYVNTFGDFMTLYDIIVIGIISYWIMVRIFAMVKDFKNPEHDEVEVVDL